MDGASNICILHGDDEEAIELELKKIEKLFPEIDYNRKYSSELNNNVEHLGEVFIE